MINREIIRIKIVQLTYAYYQNGNKNIDSAEKELFFSLSKSYDLYNYLLALIIAITKEAGRRMEVLQSRALREGTPQPSQKFVLNRFALQLGENKMLQDFMSSQKFNWADNDVIVGQLLDRIESSEIYQTYMNDKNDSYEADRDLWRHLYKAFIMNNDDIDSMLEEQSLYWNDDKDIVDTFVMKTIKRFKEQNGSKEELLPEWASEEEQEFARKLFRAAILNSDHYQRYMSETSRNWDFSRLAFMDIILMQLAIAEIMTFPNIPVSVSINEYVELAKIYSTRKSGSYINGMLDTICRNLIKSGKLLKFMEPKEPKEPREQKEPREPREPGEHKEFREPRERKEFGEPRERREFREPRERREFGEPRERREFREPRERREFGEPRERREFREPRERRDFGEPRDRREFREPRERREFSEPRAPRQPRRRMPYGEKPYGEKPIDEKPSNNDEQ